MCAGAPVHYEQTVRGRLATAAPLFERDGLHRYTMSKQSGNECVRVHRYTMRKQSGPTSLRTQRPPRCLCPRRASPTARG